MIAGIGAYLVTFLIALPILWIVLLSFQPSSEILRNPFSFDNLSLDNYAKTFRSLPLVQMYANTLVLALTSVVIGTAISLMSSFALTRMMFRRRRVQSSLRYYLLAGLAIPVYILLFPIYRLDILFGVYGTFAALFIQYVTV